MGIALSRPAKWKKLFPVLCCLILSVASRANSDNPDVPSRKDQVLSPLTLDEKYLQNGIPEKTEQGTLTLHGAVEEATVHNRDVLEAHLQVARFKWDYLAAEAARLPNIKVISYLADQTITQQSNLVPARANAFLFMSALFPITQQYRIGLEARAVKLRREIEAQRLRQRIDDTRSQVKEAYYKLALDESLLDDIQDSIKYLSQLEKTVADQVKRGNSLKVEEMEVAARLAKAHFEETKARNAYNVDRETFNHLLGRDLKSGVTLEVIPPLDELELNVDRAEEKALSVRAEIQEARCPRQATRAGKENHHV